MSVPQSSPTLADLNPAQRDAAMHGDGPALIIAGPGSGKTRVITTRITHLVNDLRVAPWHILAVTFTNKAAREMRERIERMLGEDAADLHLGTFHSMCARWLRRDGGIIGIDRNFVIYDDADQMAIMKRIIEELQLDTKRFQPRVVLSAISRAKSELISAGNYDPQDYFGEVVSRAYPRYEAALRQANALDFDDLLMRMVGLLHDDETRQRYSERYRYVMVDEFQDTNIAQYELCKLLASEHGNICVVGDPDQAIYSWRSADIRNILNFERDFPDTTTYILGQNYRSSGAILRAADAVITRNPDRPKRELWTARDQGKRIVTHVAANDEAEAEWIASVSESLHVGGQAWSDIAVMYRLNALSRPIEEALVRHRIPYRIIGGVRFYQRREVKDLLAYLRLVQNRLDEASLLRVINVPTRGIGATSIERISDAASRDGLSLWDICEDLANGQRGDLGIVGKPAAGIRAFVHAIETLRNQPSPTLPELLDKVLALSGYGAFLRESGIEGEERMENVLQMRSVLAQYEQTGGEEGDLATFLHDVSLVADVDALEDSTDAVTLITLHAAKGLEYPVVFIAGMEEAILPHRRAFDDEAQMQEERRLAYVGITRAADALYLSRAYRRFQGQWDGGNPASRFLEDIPAELTEPYGSGRTSSAPSLGGRTSGASPAGGGVPRPTSVSYQRPPAREEFAPVAATWKAGDRVAHAKFGTGTVVSTRERGGDIELTIAFEKAGIKRLLQTFAQLQSA